MRRLVLFASSLVFANTACTEILGVDGEYVVTETSSASSAGGQPSTAASGLGNGGAGGPATTSTGPDDDEANVGVGGFGGNGGAGANGGVGGFGGNTGGMTGVGGSAQSSTVSTASGGGATSFYPTEDSFVNLSQSQSNKGKLDTLRLNASTARDPKHTYLKFDLTSGPMSVQSANLILTVYDLSCSAKVWRIFDDSWNEDTLLPVNIPPFGMLIGTIKFAPGTIVIDVTNFVNSELAGDGIVTIGISSDGPKNDVSFWSKEHSDPKQWPRLDIQ